MVEKSNPDYKTYLQLNNVTIDDRVITSIERLQDGSEHPADPSLPTAPEHDLFRLNFAQGPPVERNAFLISAPSSQASQLGPDLGVQLWGGKLGVDAEKGMLTNVFGVYAVGDANSDNSTNIPHALYSGKRAAVSLPGMFPNPQVEEQR
jgi:hypothetical protein